MNKNGDDMTYIFLCAFLLLAVGAIYLMTRNVDPADVTVLADMEYMKTESPIERRLYQAVKAAGYRVVTQHRIGKYRADIYLPDYRCVLEADGAAFHSSPAQVRHDRKRDKYMRDNGYTVLRFSGSRIHRDLPGIVREISEKFRSSKDAAE